MKFTLLNSEGLGTACCLVESAQSERFEVEETAKMSYDIKGIFVPHCVPVLSGQEVSHLVLRVEHQSVYRVLASLQSGQEALALYGVIFATTLKNALRAEMA